MPDEESFIMRGASCIGRKLMVALAVAGLSLGGAGAGLAAEDDEQIALYLADLLQAGRAVIGAHQDLINDPSGGNKGLTGEVVLEEAITRFQRDNDLDPRSVDPDSRMGRLLQAQMDAIKEVVD